MSRFLERLVARSVISMPDDRLEGPGSAALPGRQVAAPNVDSDKTVGVGIVRPRLPTAYEPGSASPDDIVFADAPSISERMALDSPRVDRPRKGPGEAASPSAVRFGAAPAQAPPEPPSAHPDARTAAISLLRASNATAERRPIAPVTTAAPVATPPIPPEPLPAAQAALRPFESTVASGASVGVGETESTSAARTGSGVSPRPAGIRERSSPGDDPLGGDSTHATRGPSVEPRAVRSSEPSRADRRTPHGSGAPPRVQITIGRIEVRATALSPAASTPRSRPRPTMTLDDYLKGRERG